MYASAAIPALIYGACALRIPESPRYLVRKNRIPEARAVIKKMIGGDVDVRSSDIQTSLTSGTDEVKLSALRGPRFGLLPIVWVGILLSVFQQFVGINVIFYYSATLWRSVGFSESNSLLISTITSVTNIVTTIVAIALIDRIGRKPLLMIGAVGMIITLSVMAICFSQATGHGTERHAEPGRRQDRAGRREPLRVRVRHELGPGRLGAARRDVQQHDPGHRARRRRRRPVARELGDLDELPVARRAPDSSSPTACTRSSPLVALFFVIKAVKETKGRTLESM